ncbi:MAG: reverse transcriptase/maturase family protein [Caldilineaceae bacterium]
MIAEFGLRNSDSVNIQGRSNLGGSTTYMPYRNLYYQVVHWDNLLLAWCQARKGKRSRSAAASFELEAAEHLLQLQDELIAKSYRHGNYHNFVIHEPKQRLISAAPFADRIVHHALCNVIEPIFERCFIHDSYANRKGKGTHAALDCCQAFATLYPFVLQCDVRQFFSAIDHAILLHTLQRQVVDPDVLWLCEEIMRSGEGVLSNVYEMHYFPSDDLFAINRPRGLPIGNLTSQFWANVYLNQLDHFIKRKLKCKAFLRYVDDFLLFADDKQTLRSWRREIIDFLAELRLILHENRCQSKPVGEGIPFLGFVIFPDYRRLKRRKGIEFQRRFRANLQAYQANEISFEQLTASVQGWVNHVRYAETYGLRRTIFGNYPIQPPKSS